MNNPVLSFTISILFWLLIVGVFSFLGSKNQIDLSSQITIDAEMIGDVIEEKDSGSKQKEVDNLDKISDLKKKESKNKTAHHDHHYRDEKSKKSQSPNILYRPLPKIPSNLRKEAFRTKSIIRFYVAKDGSVKKFDFIKSSNNPRLNFLLMKQLEKWKFESSNRDFEQDVVVDFIVK